MLQFHVTRLAHADEVFKAISLGVRLKAPKRDDVMDGQLFTKFFFRDATNAASIAVPFARQPAAFSPGRPALLRKLAALVIPVLLGGSCVIASQALADTLSLIFCFGLPLTRGTLFKRTKRGRAASGTGPPQVGVAALDIERFAAKFAGLLDLRTAALPRAETRRAACLVDRKCFPARFAGAFNLPKPTQPPAFARAVNLLRLLRVSAEHLSASGAFTFDHAGNYTLTRVFC